MSVTLKRSPKHDAIARDVVARLDLVPDFTELMSADEQAALIAAYIEHEVVQEERGDMRLFNDHVEQETKAILAALPPDLQISWRDLTNRSETMTWIREEIAYALGVEVGRRLAGGDR